MGLTLITGPANAGKVALLLRRYLDALDREPVLIVPIRSDVDRVERELLRIRPALLGGSVGTFDDLFEHIAYGGEGRRVVSDVERSLVVRKAIAALRSRMNGLGRSASFSGFGDALLQCVSELEAGLVDPSDLDGDLGELYATYRDELDRLQLWDRDLLRRRGAERLASDLGAWDGAPVFVYGFEDLTGVEWALLRGLAGRAEVTVSIPYEPGRPAFASLAGTVDDLARLADGRIEELPPRWSELAAPAIAHVERALFADAVPVAPPLDGALRFFEGAGARGALELVADEILGLVRTGTAPETIGIVCPSLERWRRPLETALASFGVPHAVEARTRLDATPYGQALLSLLRFGWLGGGRRDLFAYLRSPYSGFSRTNADFLEGRLRGRAVETNARVEEETVRLRDGQPLPPLEALRTAPDALTAVQRLASTMIRNAYGLEAPPSGDASRQDLRAHDAVMRLAGELRGWIQLGHSLAVEEIVGALERAEVRGPATGEPGRVAVVDLLRARTRRFDVVFLLGLEEGTLPRRAHESPFLSDDLRRQLNTGSARLGPRDGVARDRYLFYTACTRATRRLYLVREAATDDGGPREASPFWDEVQTLFTADDVARWTRRRPLSQLTWPLDDAPTERERLRSLASLATEDGSAAEAIAAANGWQRRLERALRAFERPTALRHPLVLEELERRATFAVTELERFADCSSIWFVERLLDPKAIDPEVDARLRGMAAHQTLYKFYSGLPKELGTERVTEENVEPAVAFLARCLDDALRGVRMELTDLQARELRHGLWRDLEGFVRADAASELPLVPRRFEVLFGSERAAPELQRGLELAPGIALTGKIDRIDIDPFSSSGIVQDYKSGKTAHSAAQIESELKLQIPLYMLVLRDLVGIEPLGGVYRPLSGERKARGLLRADARDASLPGFVKSDYLDEESFWGQVDRSRQLAVSLVRRIREGDVTHDPKSGDCPTWCEYWSMCRVKRG